MTSAENHEIIDFCITELGGSASVQDYLDEYQQVHIMEAVVETVRVDQGKTWSEMMAFTLQQVKDGIPA